jgi:hypothetical protein
MEKDISQGYRASIHQEDITVPNLYIPNNKVLKYMNLPGMVVYVYNLSTQKVEER